MSDQLFKKLDTAPVYRLVYDAIEQQIAGGQLRKGDLLPTETKLAEQFGVNRSSVREGIRLLEQSGLVERKTGKRLKVSLPPFDDLASRASRALLLHEVTFRELWEASIGIEPLAARYAAERITAAEIAELRRNISQMEKSLTSVKRVVELDIEFHNILVSATRNRALTLAREPISMLFIPAGRAILPKIRTQDRIVHAHRMIVDALEKRDSDAAHDWMRRHIEDFLRGFSRTGLNLDKALGQLHIE